MRPSIDSARWTSSLVTFRMGFAFFRRMGLPINTIFIRLVYPDGSILEVPIVSQRRADTWSKSRLQGVNTELEREDSCLSRDCQQVRVQPAEIHSFRGKGISQIPGCRVHVGVCAATRDSHDELACERWHQQLTALLPLVLKENCHGRLCTVENTSQACGAAVKLYKNSAWRGFCHGATDDDGQLLDVVEHWVPEADADVGEDNEFRLQDSDALDIGIRAEKQRGTRASRDHDLVGRCHQLDG